jgi:hypothetical protein
MAQGNDMSKHTLGPWRSVKGNSQMCDDGTTIYHRGNIGVYSDAEEHGDAEADARLIAAAPELLEQLEYIVNNISGDCPIGIDLSWAQAAIAKAKGETK